MLFVIRPKSRILLCWANSVSVKVQWDNGEQVTWRRDSLAGRPIEILQPADQDEPAATNLETIDAGQDDSVGVDLRLAEVISDVRVEQAPA